MQLVDRLPTDRYFHAANHVSETAVFADAETQGSALQALQHRAFIELEFATAFLIQLSGKPYLDTFRMAFVDALPKSFGSWAKAKHTIR